MEKVTKKKYVRAGFIFVLSYLLIAAGAFVKYLAYGSFRSGDFTPEFFRAFTTCAAVTLLVYISLFTYLIYSRSNLIMFTRQLFAINVAVVLSVLVCLVVSAFELFYMPVMLAAFILAPLVNRRDVFVSNLLTNLLIAVILLVESILGSKVDSIAVLMMLVVGIFGGSTVSYMLSGVVSRVKRVIISLFIGVMSGALIFVASFLTDSFDFVQHIGFICLSVFGQPLVSLMLQPLFEAVFNLVTDSRLDELTDHNSPLMKMMIRDALGTFNHSIAVAGFAEVCAIRIGENPYLAKACAYYHDVGKLKNPSFFAENQSGYNPHDELLPDVSAKIVAAHAHDGYELCKKYRIPEEVARVTIQHHGTLPMMVFYYKAKKLTDGEVDINEYSYNGETPVSKIAAIIMVCDASEAALRARGRISREEAEKLVAGIIADRIARKQFDNCDITMRDLNIIKNTIVEQHSGVYHERVQYPSGVFKKI